MAQEPNERYASMQSFADDLDNYLNNLPVTATSQSLFYRLGKFAKRKTAVFVMSLALVASLFLGLGTTLWQNHKIKIESAKAQHVKQFMLDSFSQSNPDKHAGENISAKDILDNSVKKLQANDLLQDDVKFELYQSLGMAYDQLGFNTQAIDLLKKSLVIQPKNSLSIAYLAQNLFDSRQQKKVDALLTQTDESHFEDLPHALLAMVRARNLISKGQAKQALSLLEKLDKLPLIQENIEVISEINGIQAGAYFMQSDYTATEKILLSILDRFQLPENHSVMMSTHLDLGILYNAIGEYDKSLTILAPLEQLYRETMGDKYPELGQLYLKLSSDYRAKGDLQQAQTYAQKCYDFYVSIHGKKGAQVARAMNMLAVIHKQNYNMDKAISLLEQAITMLNESHGKNYPLTLDLKRNLAINYMAKEKNKKALALLTELYHAQATKQGENNETTLSTQASRVLALLKLDNLDEAQQLGEQTLAKINQWLPKKHRLHKSLRFNLARVYFKQKKLQKRLDLLLEIEKLANEKDPDYSSILFTIGQAYDVLDKVKEAEKYFLKAIKVNAKVYSNEHINTLQIKLQYANFLKYWKRIDEAKRLTEEVKAIVLKENYKNPTLLKWINNLENNNSTTMD